MRLFHGRSPILIANTIRSRTTCRLETSYFNLPTQTDRLQSSRHHTIFNNFLFFFLSISTFHSRQIFKTSSQLFDIWTHSFTHPLSVQSCVTDQFFNPFPVFPGSQKASPWSLWMNSWWNDPKKFEDNRQHHSIQDDTTIVLFFFFFYFYFFLFLFASKDYRWWIMMMKWWIFLLMFLLSFLLQAFDVVTFDSNFSIRFYSYLVFHFRE